MIPLYQTYTRKCVRLTKECEIDLAKNVLQIKSTLQIFSPSRASAPTLLNSTQPQNLRNCSNKLEVLTMWFCFRYDFQEDNKALRWCSVEEGHLFLSSWLGQDIINTSWSGRHKHKLVKTGAKYSGDGRSWQFFPKAFTFNLWVGINSLLSLLFRVTEMTGWQWAVSNFTRTESSRNNSCSDEHKNKS